jgi:hypothetical protein
LRPATTCSCPGVRTARFRRPVCPKAHTTLGPRFMIFATTAVRVRRGPRGAYVPRGPLSIDQQGGREMARHAVSENRPLTRRQITSRQELATGVQAAERNRRSARHVQTKGLDRTQVSSRGRQAPLVETVRSYLDVNG